MNAAFDYSSFDLAPTPSTRPRTYIRPLKCDSSSLMRKTFDAVNYQLQIVKLAGWKAAIGQPKNLPSSAQDWHGKKWAPFETPALSLELPPSVDIMKNVCVAAASNYLDSKSVERLSRLANSQANWDGHGAKAMSIKSLLNFIAFLYQYKSVPREMQLFLGFEGEIVTSWALKNGSTLDMSFGEALIELATDDHDETFPAGDKGLYQLIPEL